MALYRFEHTQIIPLTLEDSWRFFTNPRNLSELTPAAMNFRHRFEPDAERVYPGMILAYSLTPMAGIPVNWVTEITHVEPLVRFIDEQKSGPFSMWHHIHEFSEVPEGTKIHDTLYYSLPFSFLGQFAHSLFVKNQIENIFRYRSKRMKEIFQIR